MWTEQTVETLRKFALEGRSAAWIAAALGAPSRSAVIGKANRIGVKLSGSRSGAEGRQAAALAGSGRKADVRSDGSPPGHARWGSPARLTRGSAPALREKRSPAPWAFADAEVGEMRRVELVAVGEAECKWPIGDPAEDDFAYCGLEVAKGRAYCAGHCRMIYRRPNG